MGGSRVSQSAWRTGRRLLAGAHAAPHRVGGDGRRVDRYSLEQLQTLQRITAPWTPLDWPFCVPTKRIAFVENAAKRAVRLATLTGQGKAPHRGNRPSHANYIAYYGPHPDVFACVFSWFGHIVVPTGTVVTGPTLMTQTTEPHE